VEELQLLQGVQIIQRPPGGRCVCVQAPVKRVELGAAQVIARCRRLGDRFLAAELDHGSKSCLSEHIL
jgi:hypothetical protein